MAESNLWQSTCRERVNAPQLEGDAQADLAIIGGGFTGCAAALTAAQAGATVRLLEARIIGHGGSGRNVGLVNAGLWLPPDEICAYLGAQAGERLSALLAEAPAQVFDLIDRHGIDCDAQRSGTLHCAHAPRGLDDLVRRCDQQQVRGAPAVLLHRAETASRTGSKAFHAALFDPRAGTIQPTSYVCGLARAATGAGARLHQQTPVEAIGRDGGGWRLQTPCGVVRAQYVLQATNAYHMSAGTTAQDYVPVHFFQYATAPLPATERARILPGGEGVWDTALVMSSFRLDRDGRMLVGAMGQPDHFAGQVHRDWARRKLRAVYPALGDLPFEHGWSGRIAMTSDHLPKVVRLGPGALSIHGYSGRGIAPGTIFGICAAQALLQEDEAPLPIPAQDGHRERLAALRQIYYETGATLTHLLATRRGRS